MKGVTFVRHRPSFTLLGLVLILACLSAPSWTAARDANDKEKTKAELRQRLVWPLPPQSPRIRWLSEFSRFEDIEGKKKEKRSWFERLAGVKEKKEDYRGLTSPYGIAVDSRDRIYVADWSSGGVLVLDRRNRRVDVRGPSTGIPLRLPLGVAVGENDQVFISDAILHTITCLTADGEVVAQFGYDELVRPTGLALDPKRHRLYVADSKAHRIAVFDTQTFQFKQHIGRKSLEPDPGTFRSPVAVAVDHRGFLYVADTMNHRVQVFNRLGRFVRTFGEHGNAPGQFSRPKGIAVDSQGHIYVADAEFNNFQIFDQAGQVLLFVGTLGSKPGQFTLLTDLYIDNQDRIYTTERYRPRVQIFQYIPLPEESGETEVSRNQ